LESFPHIDRGGRWMLPRMAMRGGGEALGDTSGVGPANGGTGASVTMNNVVSGYTAGTLNLNQDASGGSSGVGSNGGVDGIAGNADVHPHYQQYRGHHIVLERARHWRQWRRRAGRIRRPNRPDGGTATSQVQATGPGTVTAEAEATGGEGGGSYGQA